MSLLQQEPGFDFEKLIKGLVQVGFFLLFFGAPIIKSIFDSKKQKTGAEKPKQQRRRRAPQPPAESEPAVLTWDDLVQQARMEATTERKPKPKPQPKPVTSVQPKKKPKKRKRPAEPSAPRGEVGALAERHLDEFATSKFASEERESVAHIIEETAAPLTTLDAPKVTREAGKPKVSRSIRAREWRNAIILREVLDRPVSMREAGPGSTY